MQATASVFFLLLSLCSVAVRLSWADRSSSDRVDSRTEACLTLACESDRATWATWLASCTLSSRVSSIGQAALRAARVHRQQPSCMCHRLGLTTGRDRHDRLLGANREGERKSGVPFAEQPKVQCAVPRPTTSPPSVKPFLLLRKRSFPSHLQPLVLVLVHLVPQAKSEACDAATRSRHAPIKGPRGAQEGGANGRGA